jgi:hypothetical protein
VDYDSMADSAADFSHDIADDEGWANTAGDGIETDAATAERVSPAWARPDVTGVASVDAAIGELAGLDALPTSEHVAVYEGLHRQLQDALADLDGA